MSNRKKLHVSMMKCISESVIESLRRSESSKSNLHFAIAYPYDRMVAMQLKRIATCQDGVKLVKVVLDGEVLKSDEQVGGEWIEDTSRLERRDTKADASAERNIRLTAVIDDVFAGSETEADITHWHILDIFDTMNLRPSDVSVRQLHGEMKTQFIQSYKKVEWDPQKILLGIFKAVFYVVDKDGSNALSAAEIRECVQMLGMNEEEWTDEAIKTLINKYDTDGNGELESDEFISYMMSIYAAAPPKVKGEYYDQISNKPWMIPIEGKLALTVEVEKSTASVDEVAPDSGVEGLLDLIKAATTDSEKEKLFRLSTANTDTYFTRHQAQRLIDMCRSTISILEMVESCVRVAASPEDANAIVEHNLQPDQKVNLRLRMGQAWRPRMGLPGGTYVLHYGNQEDNMVGQLMASFAVSEREVSNNNTSQLGDWLNFRNVTEQIREENEDGSFSVK